jgi:hypothetical protein
MQMQTIDTNSDSKASKLSAIDRALELAKQRAAMAAATRAGLEEAPAKPKVKIEREPKVVDLEAKAAKDAERAAAKAKMDAERSERRAAADAKRAEAKAERSAKQSAHGPVHMKKVDKAASKLPALSEAAQTKLNELKLELSNIDMTALALHMQHHVRVAATSAAHGRKFTNGQRVRIVGGDPRFIDQVGIIDQARNIRCFVNVEGAKKPVYVFTSDIEPFTEEG